MAPQVGFKMVIKYTPSTSMVYPDPEGGNWATALGHYNDSGDYSGWFGDLFHWNSDQFTAAVDPSTLTDAYIDYSNILNAVDPYLQVVLTFSSVILYDLAILELSLVSILEGSGLESNLSAFDSGGAVLLQSWATELWSNTVL